MKKILNEFVKMGAIGGFMFVFGLPLITIYAASMGMVARYLPRDLWVQKYIETRRPAIAAQDYNQTGRGTNTGRLYDHMDTQYYRAHAGAGDELC